MQEELLHHEEPVHQELLHPEAPETYDPHAYDPHGDLAAEPGQHHYADHHEDEAHHVYDDADVYAAGDHPDHHFDEPGHPLMGAGSSAAGVPAKSKKVRRRRRCLALLLTLTVFVIALVIGAQFLKPLLGGDTIDDYPGPGTGQMNGPSNGDGTRSVATELEDQKVIANPDTFLHALTASGGSHCAGATSSPPRDEELRRRGRPAG